MTEEFVSFLNSHGFFITELTSLPSKNPLNATQLYQGQLVADDGTKQAVFVKRLVSPYSAINYKQFCQEIATLQACQSLSIKKSIKKPPYGVAHLINFNSEQLNSYFITPFYHGETLKNLIQNNKLDFEQKITYAISLCHLIKQIHCLGYLHCDIKPNNIFVTSHNQVLLLDFGLSQALNKPFVQTDFIAGTPAYMSPEQFNGLPLTSHSDFYSLGIVLYELFFGKLPFYADNLHDWTVAHCQQALPLLPNLANFSQNQQNILQTIFNQLLAKLPIHRYHDWQEIIELLSKLAF